VSATNPVEPAAPILHEVAQQYLTFLRVERRLSANTLQSYERDIAALHNTAPQKQLAAFTPQDIKRNLASLHSKGLSPRSIARLLSAWRGYFAYAITVGAATTNPTAGLKPPKAAKTLPKALSPDEAVALVHEGADEAKEGNTTRLRDHAMFELLYSSGLRVSELTDLNCAEIDVSNALVRVTGKGNKTRIIPIGTKAVEALKSWLSARSSYANVNNIEDADAAFITPTGQRVYPRLVQRTIKKWATEKSISQDVHPHMLRHSFASHVLQSSGDLRAVQEMLGHASITSTQVYTHLDFQHLAKVYDVAHPRAKLKAK
jgi:integrase/recombinase XerC